LTLRRIIERMMRKEEWDWGSGSGSGCGFSMVLDNRRFILLAQDSMREDSVSGGLDSYYFHDISITSAL
jgi:hypothetical protein